MDFVQFYSLFRLLIPLLRLGYPERYVSMNTETKYYVDCECGDSVAVNKTDAGGSTVCRCGAMIVVPLLSQLRKNAGLDGIELSIGDRISAKIENGDLPPSLCVACNASDAVTSIRLFAECETSTTNTSGGSIGHSFCPHC